MTTSTIVEAEARYLIISPSQYGLEWGLTTLDPRVDELKYLSGRRYLRLHTLNAEYVNSVNTQIRNGTIEVLYHFNDAFRTEDTLPLRHHSLMYDHPFHGNDDWKGIHHLADSISVTYDVDGVPHLTVAADVQFANANAPYIPAPPLVPVAPGAEGHWGVRRLMVHDITYRLRQAAVQFTNEMQFYWSGQDGNRFWATERQLTSWIAMTREHLAILASGNTAHTVSIEVGTPSDLGRPVHQIPILEALPWMMDQLETMLSKGVLHFFDFHSDVLHSELGISPSKPTYFLWGVDGAGLVSQRMVREIIESDWDATRKFEYAAARRGDPVSYTESYVEKLHAAALRYDSVRLAGLQVSVNHIKEWYESWLGYGSKLHQDDEHGDEITLADAAGATTKIAAGEHVLAVLARHPDPQALHDAHSTDLAAKLTARELWDMDASGALGSRVSVDHTSAEWEQLKEQFYDGSLTNRE